MELLLHSSLSVLDVSTEKEISERQNDGFDLFIEKKTKARMSAISEGEKRKISKYGVVCFDRLDNFTG